MVQSYYNVLNGIEAAVLAAGTTISGVAPPGTAAPVLAGAATLAVTPAAHAGQLVKLTRVAGVTVTLPLAANTGNVYRFVTGVPLSGGNHVFQVNNVSDVFFGLAFLGSSGGVSCFQAGQTANGVTLNATTTGGLGTGNFATFIDIGTNFWAVLLFLYGSGTLATPFGVILS